MIEQGQTLPTASLTELTSEGMIFTNKFTVYTSQPIKTMDTRIITKAIPQLELIHSHIRHVFSFKFFLKEC